MVLGGAGFIGSHFIRFILQKRPSVKILNYDALTYSGNLENLKDISKHKSYQFVRGDITNLKQLEVAFRKFIPDFPEKLDKLIKECSITTLIKNNNEFSLKEIGTVDHLV